MKKKNITVIGGGACGVATFLELFIQLTSHHLQDQASITLIEKEKPVGFGVAFGTDQPGHLLNTQADIMGIFASEPNHFVTWIEKTQKKVKKSIKGRGDTENVYSSRKLYGIYINEQFNAYLQRASEVGLKVDVIEGEATKISFKDGNYKVRVGRKSIDSAFVILAMGNPEPNKYSEFKDHPKFVHTPYPADKMLKKLSKKDHVGILGNSLSAIDTVITLVDNGHKGKITMASPEGLLPRVQPVTMPQIKRTHLTLENIHHLQRQTLLLPRVADLVGLFKKEVEQHHGKPINWKSENRMGKDPGKLLKKDLKTAKKGGDAFILTAYSLRHDTATIWNWMSVGEKAKFKKWFGVYWAINRHSMPIPNAERLVKLFEKGTLKLVPYLEDVKETIVSSFEICTREDSYRVDLLVNATGAATQLEDMDSPLIKNLLDQQFLKPYPLGGAVVNPRTMQLGGGKAGKHMYAVGHLVNGVLLDVNAVWYNVKTIQYLCQNIILDLRHGECS